MYTSKMYPRWTPRKDRHQVLLPTLFSGEKTIITVAVAGQFFGYRITTANTDDGWYPVWMIRDPKQTKWLHIGDVRTDYTYRTSNQTCKRHLHRLIRPPTTAKVHQAILRDGQWITQKKATK
jgi:hypothetical protein